MNQYIDPKNLSQKQAKHNNNFAVGDIIQHKIYSYCSLITNVDTSTREYVVMYIEDDAREATLSFVYCHQQYELALH